MKKIIFLFLIVNCTLVIAPCLSQWQPDVRLTNNPAVSYTSYNNAWCIASSGDSVHVVWYDFRDGNGEIYYKRSSDGGASWGADTRLTNNTSDSWRPSISVLGPIVHVVWYDERDGNWEIYYKRSSDGGTSWGADTRLTNNSAASNSPSVSVSGSSVHVVWYDERDGNFEIYYKRSTDGGISWGADTRLTNSSDVSSYATVSASGGVVLVVWMENAGPAVTRLFYRRSADGGMSWGTVMSLSYLKAPEAKYPSISISGLDVHAIWFDRRDGNYEIYYIRSTNGGISWGFDTRLTNNFADSYYPSVSVSGQVVHVVFEDNRDGNYEIYYKRSTDRGISWGADTRLTNNSAFSYWPSVSVSGSTVHVVWSDLRNGNFEIYYKRDPTGNPVGIININSEIPNQFSLSQNYPNPFNPTTKIRFAVRPPLYPLLSKEGTGVVLKIFDVLGREVATLVNESLQPGTYEVDWDASNFPSGVYYYTLQTENFTETKKMILIK